MFIGLLQSFVLSCSLGYYCLLLSCVHWVVTIFCPLVFIGLLLSFALVCSLGCYNLLSSRVHWVITVFCSRVFTGLLQSFVLSCSLGYYCLRSFVLSCPLGSYCLRSASDTLSLQIPRTRLSTVGELVFTGLLVSFALSCSLGYYCVLLSRVHSVYGSQSGTETNSSPITA